MTKYALVETAPVKSVRDNDHIEQFTEHRPTQEFGLKERKKK